MTNQAKRAAAVKLIEEATRLCGGNRAHTYELLMNAVVIHCAMSTGCTELIRIAISALTSIERVSEQQDARKAAEPS